MIRRAASADLQDRSNAVIDALHLHFSGGVFHEQGMDQFGVDAEGGLLQARTAGFAVRVFSVAITPSVPYPIVRQPTDRNSGVLFFPISLSPCACSGGERNSPSRISPCWRKPSTERGRGTLFT